MQNDQITAARQYLETLEELERKATDAYRALVEAGTQPATLRDAANDFTDAAQTAPRRFRDALDAAIAHAASAAESDDRHARTPLLREMHSRVWTACDGHRDHFLSPVAASRSVVEAALSTRGQDWAVAPIAGDGPAVLSGVDLADALEELVRRGPKAGMAVFFMGDEPASWEPAPAQEASYYWTELETGPESGVYVDLVTAL